MRSSLFVCIEFLLAAILHTVPGELFAGQFLTPATYPAGHAPIALATGDFNADGHSDIAVVNVQGSNVSVFIATPDGTLGKPVNYPVGLAPVSIAIGDVNGDGKLDLVVANHGDPKTLNYGSVSILLGKGDGTFRKAMTYDPGPLFPVNLTLGDVNGDAKLDVAMVTLDANNQRRVSILLGNGDGTFRAGASYSGSSHLLSVRLADFNHDGKLDLTELQSFYCCGAGAINVALGNGDGTFQAGTNYKTDYDSRSMDFADFNRDGNLDIIVANQSNRIALLLGNGDGTFQPAILLGPPQFSVSTSIAAGDFNGDGNPDFVVAGPNILQLLLGNGDGSFQDPTRYDVGSDPLVVGTSDFNGDGKIDVVILDQATDRINVALGNGDGTLQAGREFPGGGGRVTSADFNNDGAADVLFSSSPNTWVALGNGDGTLRTGALVSNFAGGALGAADFNGDHNQDVAVGNGSSDLAISLGNGDGTFQSAMNFFAGGSTDFQPGDFNRDGKLDLAVPTGRLVNILLGNGDGTFRRPSNQGFGTNAIYLSAGDFNRDGNLDLVTTGGNAYILLAKGDGTFKRRQKIGPAGISLRIGDFNKDGKLDVILWDGSGGLTVLLGNGDGTFQTKKTFYVGSETGQWSVRDFNGDGKLDIALLQSNGDISLFLGNGDGTFQPAVNYLGGGASYLTAADFNGDGATDLVVSRQLPATQDLVVILNKGGSRMGLTSSSSLVRSKQAVMFTVTMVASVSGSGIPAGTVTFRDGESVLGTAILDNGTATITTGTLSVGKHTVVAFYSGDAYFNPRSSPTLLQTVSP